VPVTARQVVVSPGASRTAVSVVALAAHAHLLLLARCAQLASFLMGPLVALRDVIAQVVESRFRCRPSGPGLLTFGSWLLTLFWHALTPPVGLVSLSTGRCAASGAQAWKLPWTLLGGTRTRQRYGRPDRRSGASAAACHDRRVRTRATPLGLLASLIVALGGCSSATTLLHTASHGAANAAPGVPANVVGVIVGWSKALQAGHVAAAAHYFDLPSVFFSGSGPPIEMRSLAQVEAVNAGLPCGARFLSARKRGGVVNVLFRLTDRLGPGGAAGCGAGTGQTARTNFVIRDGHIEEWLRAPDEPGDNGSPRTPPLPRTPSGPGATPSAPSQQI
jgi:hypothetical protein